MIDFLKDSSYHIMMPDESELFGTVAGKAYPLDYPLFTYFFGKKVNRQKIIDAFILDYKVNCNDSICYSFEDVSKGNVLFKTPESSVRRKNSVICGQLFKILFRYGPRPLLRMSKYNKMANKMIDEIEDAKIIYVSNLIISNEYQGKNLIEDLSVPLILYADNIGATICFETFSISNVELYQHYGFELVKTEHLPDSDIELYFLKRTPNNELQ